MSSVLSLENPVFTSFLFYGSTVVLKTMAMSQLTGMYRLSRQAFANQEDCDLLPAKKLTPITNPDVERVRRCHLNDLENVIPFVLIGLLYTMTSPDAQMAKIHFRIFAGARFFHTLAYLIPLPQPARGLSFWAGFISTTSMAISVLNKATF